MVDTVNHRRSFRENSCKLSVIHSIAEKDPHEPGNHNSGENVKRPMQEAPLIHRLLWDFHLWHPRPAHDKQSPQRDSLVLGGSALNLHGFPTNAPISGNARRHLKIVSFHWRRHKSVPADGFSLFRCPVNIFTSKIIRIGVAPLNSRAQMAASLLLSLSLAA